MPRSTRELTFDGVFRALSDPDRRRLCIALLRADPLEELSVPEGVRVGDSDIDDLRGAFHHVHLPLLETLGLVEWEAGDSAVSRGPNFGELRPVLEVLDEYGAVHTDE